MSFSLIYYITRPPTWPQRWTCLGGVCVSVRRCDGPIARGEKNAQASRSSSIFLASASSFFALPAGVLDLFRVSHPDGLQPA